MKILKFLGLFLVLAVTLAGAVLYEGDIPSDVVDARYSSPSSQFLDLGDAGRIHYRDDGNRRHPAVLLIHGSAASLHTFEPWVERLSGEYRVITLDLPGHGLTGAVPSADYSLAAYIDVVHALANHLSLDTFVIGGNSMGGGVAWRYALAHPAQVRALVLINATGLAKWRDDQTGNNTGNNSAVLVFELLRKPWFRAIAEKIDPYYLAQQGVTSAYNHSNVVNESLIMRYYDLNLRAGTRKATIDRFQQLGQTPSADLSQIKTPTLVMWGQEDALIPFSHAARFEAAIPDTRTAYYQDVGHVPMEEIPDQSARDLSVFLQALNR